MVLAFWATMEAECGMEYTLHDCIGGYEGGGFIQLPSGLLICLRSEENSARYVSAGITRKNLKWKIHLLPVWRNTCHMDNNYLWCSCLKAKSERNVSVTYLWKYVGNGSVVSRSKTKHLFGLGLCMKNTW